MPLTLDEARALFPESLTNDSIEKALDELARIVDGRGFIVRTHEEPRLQGDIVDHVPFLVRHQEGFTVTPARVMLLSNSCDMANAHTRVFPARVTVAPALRVSRWRDMLNDVGVAAESIDSMIGSAERQAITAVMYVKADGVLEEDLVVLLDQVQSMTVEELDNTGGYRLAVLTPRGHWVALLKLSNHFCRLREGVDRLAA